MNSRILFVAGSHRSGTSLLAGLCQLLDYDHTDSLVPSNEFNPKGYFEDANIVSISEAVLAEHSLSWWDALYNAVGSNPESVSRELSAQARNHLSDALSRSPKLIIKDPRFCVTFPFWEKVAHQLGADFDLIVTWRDPEEIAASLIRRDGFHVSHCRLLILSYWLQILYFGQDVLRTVVNINALMRDPEVGLTRLFKSLPGASDAGSLPDVGPEAFEFIESGLMTQSESVEGLYDGVAGELLREVSALLRDPADLPSRQRVQQLWSRWSSLSQAFGEVSKLRGPSWRLNSLPLGVAKGSAPADQLLSLAEREDELRAHSMALEERASSLTSREELLRSQEMALAERVSSVAASEEALKSQVSGLESQVGSPEVAITSMRSSLSWRCTLPLRLFSWLPYRVLTHWRWAMSRPSMPERLWALIPLTVYRKDRLTKALPLKRLGSKIVGQSHEYNIAQQQLKLEQFEDVGDVVSWESRHRQYMPKITDGDRFREGGFDVRAIALYLPQYHQIKENDEWWGEGFTEWVKVKKAKPIFQGHLQPAEPHEDLGYYDLGDPSVLARQAELARSFGIEGFCFYFYWFGGKTLLESPIKQLLASPEIDLPFMLCWANENWTRTWDGLDSEVLIEQKHSPEDDIAFIEHLAPYFADSRYIKVHGKPVLVLYRPDLLPDAVATVSRWRQWARDQLGADLFLIATTSFGAVDPEAIGFDQVMEFTPNNSSPKRIESEVEFTADNFRGCVYDWRSVAAHSEDYKIGDCIYRTLCPSWDNTPRRPDTGAVFAGSTPTDFGKWVRNARKYTIAEFPDPEERLLFFNAWNEWAEGAVLEPNRVYGYAYLTQLLAAVAQKTPDQLGGKKHGRKKVLLVGHDALPFGAQMLLLELTRHFIRHLDFDVYLILLEGGDLVEEYLQLGVSYSILSQTLDQKGLLESLYADGYRHAICNSIATRDVPIRLDSLGYEVMTLVHEMPDLIKRGSLDVIAREVCSSNAIKVFPSEIVAVNFEEFGALEQDKYLIRPQGIYKPSPYRFANRGPARVSLRSKFSLDQDTLIVLGMGYADERKGPDLFVSSAIEILASRTDVSFIWVGEKAAHFWPTLEALIDLSDQPEKIIFTGFTDSTFEFFAGSDVFVLSSREDPFPSVVLEAMDVDLPVVAMRGKTGIEGLVDTYARGYLADSAADLPDALLQALIFNSKSTSETELVSHRFRLAFSFEGYINSLLAPWDMGYPKISVVVPSYNYARFLPERLASIEDQTVPIHEVIIIDDCSTDDSWQIIKEYQARSRHIVFTVSNEINSGAPIAQWIAGARLATGDFIWIAEADDLAEPDFLEHLMPGVSESTVLAYTDAQQIDEHGEVIERSYRKYWDDVHSSRWASDFWETGATEIQTSLSIKNTIPTASAAVFRADALREVMALHEGELLKYRYAADWYLYTKLMSLGDVHFKASSLVAHRRHHQSRTHDQEHVAVHLEEIAAVQSSVASMVHLDSTSRTKAREWLASCKEFLRSGSQSTVEVVDGSVSPAPESAKKLLAIAFHLPQFHPIPENNEWWGDGFTEWTNVASAKSLFAGHQQPKLPGALGFYDLRLSEARAAQSALAKQHGIDAFCYWHYWFEGKRLLERPVDERASSTEPGLPFCLAWANESWSRRWLGEEEDILLAQTYSDADDDVHTAFLVEKFNYPGYLRYEGRPVFLVYRPTAHPNIENFCRMLRAKTASSVGTEPYLIGINAHDVWANYQSMGFDIGLHFMPQLGVLPNAFVEGSSAAIRKQNEMLGISSSRLKTFDYREAIRLMREQEGRLRQPSLSCVVVGWDNTPRRGEQGIVLINDSPEAFGEQVRTVLDELSEEKHPILFINAWNEWAEGNFLEPTSRGGKVYLDELKAALYEFRRG